MSRRLAPPFRADHVGSLLRPPALLAAREQWRNGDIGADELRAAEDEAIRAAIRMQEAIGLAGRHRRRVPPRALACRFPQGLQQCRDRALDRSRCGSTPSRATSSARRRALRVTGRLARPAPIFVAHFAYLKSVARAVPKITIPSPSLLHFRGGRDLVDRAAYPEIGRLLRRSRPRLRRGDRRSRRRRLPLSPDRRDQLRLPLRPRVPRAGARPRRGPGRAAGFTRGSSTPRSRRRRRTWR